MQDTERLKTLAQQNEPAILYAVIFDGYHKAVGELGNQSYDQTADTSQASPDTSARLDP